MSLALSWMILCQTSLINSRLSLAEKGLWFLTLHGKEFVSCLASQLEALAPLICLEVVGNMSPCFHYGEQLLLFSETDVRAGQSISYRRPKEKTDERKDLLFGLAGVAGYNTARTASSKTSLSPSWARAEHCMNLCAPKVLAKRRPSFCETIVP